MIPIKVFQYMFPRSKTAKKRFRFKWHFKKYWKISLHIQFSSITGTYSIGNHSVHSLLTSSMSLGQRKRNWTSRWTPKDMGWFMSTSTICSLPMVTEEAKSHHMVTRWNKVVSYCCQWCFDFIFLNKDS